MELRRRIARRAHCVREEQKDRLIYHWPLSRLVMGKQPALVLTWHENGAMSCRILEHDTVAERSE